MKGLVVTAGHQVELQTIGDPTPGPYEALVRIRACGICSSTDRELIAGTQPYNKAYPCLLGHEAIGEVVALGAGVRSFAVGDWVTRPVGIWPGERRDGLTSAWGGFAEYGIVRDRQARMADGDASLATDYTALRQNRIDRRGLDVPALVLGISLAETASWSWQLLALGGATVCIAGTGIAGLSLALWAKLAGARMVVVLGRRAERLALAKRCGADVALDTSAPGWEAELQRISNGGCDVFCEAVGSRELLRAGVRGLRPGGTAAIYGVAEKGDFAFDRALLTEGRTLVVPEAREHLAYDWVCDLMRRGVVPVDDLLTHRWPLADHAKAFAAIAAGGPVKGLLDIA
jgi:2-desacetyl-2-hydroxyethyl bacteriochlorophyllide A dehydrogenase